jgi:hypothetical protein
MNEQIVLILLFAIFLLLTWQIRKYKVGVLLKETSAVFERNLGNKIFNDVGSLWGQKRTGKIFIKDNSLVVYYNDILENAKVIQFGKTKLPFKIPAGYLCLGVKGKIENGMVSVSYLATKARLKRIEFEISDADIPFLSKLLAELND